jgi:hypothetical protein
LLESLLEFAEKALDIAKVSGGDRYEVQGMGGDFNWHAPVY